MRKACSFVLVASLMLCAAAGWAAPKAESCPTFATADDWSVYRDAAVASHDFGKCLCALLANPALEQFSAELGSFSYLLDQLDPTVADINGSLFVNAADPDNLIIEIEGNGLVDADFDLALLQAVLLAADGTPVPGVTIPPSVDVAQIRAAFTAARTRLIADVKTAIGPPYSSLPDSALINMAGELVEIMAAYVLLGDGTLVDVSAPNIATATGSLGFVSTIFHFIKDDVVIFNLANYTSFPALLSAGGDFDGDGSSNADEFASFNFSRDMYLAGVSNPQLTAGDCPDLSDDTLWSNYRDAAVAGHDFEKSLCALLQNPVLDQFSEDLGSFGDLLAKLNPSVADINGSVHIDSTGADPVIDVVGNGMLDAKQELMLLRLTLLHAEGQPLPGGVALPPAAQAQADAVKTAFYATRTRMGTDAGQYGFILKTAASELIEILAAYAMLGDGTLVQETSPDIFDATGSIGFVSTIFNFVPGGSFNAANYTSFPDLYAADGDYDGDGATNKEEYDAFGANGYVAAAANPLVKPDAPVEGQPEEGETPAEGELPVEGEIPVEGEPVEGQPAEGEILGDFYTDPTAVDFYTVYGTLQGASSTFLTVFESLNPDSADINGGYNEVEMTFEGNGMLDCLYELAIIPAIANKPTGSSLENGYDRDDIVSDWEANYTKLQSDLGPAGRALELLGDQDVVESFYALMTAFITMGDEQTLLAAQLVIDTATAGFPGVSIDLMTYRVNGDILGADGDADGDGYTNMAEYGMYAGGKNAEEYLVAVLDPSTHPEGCPDSATTWEARRNAAMETADFAGLFCALLNNPLLEQFGDELAQFSSLIDMLDPALADINGSVSVDANSEVPMIEIAGNDMLDAKYEFGVLGAILAAGAVYGEDGPDMPEGLDVEGIKLAFGNNFEQLLKDVGGAYGPSVRFMAPELVAILAAYMTLGDGTLAVESESGVVYGEGSLGFVSTVFSFLDFKGTLTLENYVSFPELAASGDADGDGYSNFSEYLYVQDMYQGDPWQYIFVALDPTESPDFHVVTVSVEGDGVVEKDGDMFAGYTTIESGGTSTLIAIPNLGVEFAGWFVNGEFVNADTILTLTADSDLNVEAVFTASQVEGEPVEGALEGEIVEGEILEGEIEGEVLEGEVVEGESSEGEVVVTVDAMFGALITVGDAPLTVDFSDFSLVTGNDFIASWIWNFGDGNDSFDQNPTHVYTMAGSYNVTLTVTTNGGLNSVYTIDNFITVNPPQFEGQPAEGEVVEGEVPAEGQPVEGEVIEGEVIEGALPEEGQAVEGQVAEGQPAEGQVAEGQAVEGQTEEGQSVEGQTAEGQAAEGQAKEGQTPEGAKPEGAKPEGQDTDKEGQATANDGEPAGTNSTVTFGCAG